MSETQTPQTPNQPVDSAQSRRQRTTVPDAYARRLEIAEKDLGGDRPALFELASKVSAMHREAPYPVMFTDANSGMDVGRFLHRVLELEAETTGAPVPRLVHIANSRSAVLGAAPPIPTEEERATMGERRYRRAMRAHERGVAKAEAVHRGAIEKYMRQHSEGAKRALLVTDTVSEGTSMRRLGDVAQKVGMRPDYAVLAANADEAEVARRIGAPEGSKVASVRLEHDLYMRKPHVVDYLGYFTKLGVAEPQVYAPAHVGTYGLQLVANEQFYTNLAEEYAATHQQPPMPPTGTLVA